MRIAIVGPGLIGRSIALAARRADAETAITEIDSGNRMELARGADLIVIATPVDVILQIIREHSELLRSSVVLDVGSTKRAIVAAARDAGLTRFVGGHPMAGGSTSGPSEARADLFDARPFFLIPRAATPDARNAATAFVERLGAQPIVMDDDGTEHDRAMAAISHLPQVVASMLMMLIADRAPQYLQWAGTGLRDTTRLAGSSAGTWQPIVGTNATELKPLIRELARQLDSLADRLDDGRSVAELFDKANRARALL